MYVTCMLLVCICMLLVCICMLLVCICMLLVCTRMYSYVTRMLLVCYRGTRRLFSVNICSKKQILPRNYDSSRKAKNFQMAGHFFDDFQSSFISFATTSLRILQSSFSHFTPQIWLSFVKKGPLGFSDLKIVTERGIGKSYVVLNLQMSSKIFGKREALINSKSVKLPQDDRTDRNFIVPLRKHMQNFKSTPDNLKQIFKAFGRKPSLGAPDVTRMLLMAQCSFSHDLISPSHSTSRTKSQSTINTPNLNLLQPPSTSCPMLHATTVKPVLSGPHIKRTPAWVPKLPVFSRPFY